MPDSPIDIEQSHGRARVVVRDTPAMPAPPVPPADLSNRKANGQFGPGNAAAKRRRLKSLAMGISTIDPAQCEPWLAPHVKASVEHGMLLSERFADPVLNALCGATADALAMFKGLVTLAAKGDEKARTEARGWLREFRSCMVDLAALAAVQPDDYDETEGMRGILELAKENETTKVKDENEE